MTNSIKTYHHKNLRATLLDGAAAMISEEGVESVTMRALGQRLGVSRGAPYRHFSNKADLLRSVAATGFADLGKRLQGILSDSELSTEKQLQQLGEVYVNFALEHPAHYRLMYGSEALSRHNHPNLKSSGDALFALLKDAIGTFQRETGATKKDTKVLTYVAWSAVHGLASLLIEEQIMVEIDVEDLIYQTMCTVIDGIKGQDQC